MTNYDNINWEEEVAKEILIKEKYTKQFTYPEPISAIISWRGKLYIGSIQEIVPEFSKEIVILSKSTKSISEKLIEALRRLDQGRLELFADESLDLEGRQHIVRRLDNKLEHMTRKQTIFMTNFPIKIYEIS